MARGMWGWEVSAFCKGCSIEHFGKDYGDFIAVNPGMYQVLCEGCGGWVIVNEHGERDQEYGVITNEGESQ